MLQTVSYLIKTLIESSRKTDERISSADIIQDIHELFLVFPPTNLKKGIPNFDFLYRIYELLRMLTDLAKDKNMTEAKSVLGNLRNKENSCQIFLNYLEATIHR